jgi:hypothetical protein
LIEGTLTTVFIEIVKVIEGVPDLAEDIFMMIP